MMQWRRTRWLGLVLLGAVLTAQSPAPLDLKAALETANTANLELRAARQQRALALAGITTARQFPNPTVSFSVSRDAPHESALWDQPLDIAGQRGKRIAVAREEQRSIELDIAALERQVRRRTREAFYRALAAREQTQQAKAALDLTSRLKEIVQERFDAGDVAQLDVIEADVELSRATADYETSLQSQKSADVALAALLNRPLDEALTLAGTLATVPPAPALASLTTSALTSNADVQKTTQDLRTEERRLSLAKSERIPRVDLQVGTDLNAPPDFNVGPRGQIAVAVPLFYHGQGEVAQSSARLEALRLTLQSQQVNVSAEIAAAYYDYAAKQHLAQQYQERIVPESVRLEEMAEESYRSGKSNLLTLIEAQRRLNEVRKGYIDSLLATQSAFAALEETVGAPLD